MNSSSVLISTILKHDTKQTSYKIALLRAINDITLNYPDLRHSTRDIAVPLRLIAEFWLAYYWPLMDAFTPILQGTRSRRGEVLRHALSFRPALTELKVADVDGSSRAGGWLRPHPRPKAPEETCNILDNFSEFVRDDAQTVGDHSQAAPTVCRAGGVSSLSPNA